MSASFHTSLVFHIAADLSQTIPGLRQKLPHRSACNVVSDHEQDVGLFSVLRTLLRNGRYNLDSAHAWLRTV